MGRAWLAFAAAAGLMALAGLLAASEQPARSPNATDIRGAPWQSRPAAVSRAPPPRKENPSPPRPSAWRGANASTAKASQAAGAKESQLKPPAVLPGGNGGDAVASDIPAAGSPPGASVTVRYFSGEMEEKNVSGLCLGCPGGTLSEPFLGGRDGKGPLEALSGGTGFAQPAQGQEGAWKLLDGKDGAAGSPRATPESQEEAGSGDQPAKASPDQGELAERTTTPRFAPEASSSAGLGHSSAETDLLLNTFGVAVLASPTRADVPAPEEGGAVPEQDSAQKEEPLELWVESSSSSPAEGAQGRTDRSWPGAETPRTAVTPPIKASPKPSQDPLASEIIDIDYYDLFDGERLGGAGLDSTKRKPVDDKGMSWSLHDLYDDFTPFDESDFYPTTSFYTDGDEEDLDEPEEEEEEEDGGGGLARDLEDENGFRIPTQATPKIHTAVQEAEPTSRRYVVPPLQTFVITGGGGRATPRPRPAEVGRDLSLLGVVENGTECRSGFVRHNNSCKSMCDTFPSYCHNGGQCYLVENLGAFCRCNTQDYIWHKGIRCESIITDFQVMCIAVGSAALVVLLLFMMTVFFAKKLYLLKTENSKLRKTKYRTPSELHNDNFSLSTIAEGSHPNVRKFCDTPSNLSPHARALAYYDNIICQDDPHAPHKLQDPLKSCLKDEESFNIQNSMSPKLDNGKGETDDSEVNCLQNNLT
ncbi:chondroitin sulfate proteoglycan 5 isoform X1 [Podarcis raffonei]|uniref:chondroitin sulfate proteoglycan 5 isoform X1 n=1 Tax=Podarcis raffonei TaxID=65483 RepID=UPI00232915C5|nr:chondroitin sulfate proteoglycan 5 isoform X1 [Podarcis raffonei]